MRAGLIVVLCALAVGASANNGRRLFYAGDILGKSSVRVDQTLGRPRSIGQMERFREYGAPNAGIYVAFRGGRSKSVVVTFRIPFNKPTDAVSALGIDVTNRKPKRKTISEREWRDVDGFPYIHVSSSDGRLWETVEVGEVPKP